jgi:hypothetical protein
MYKVVLKRVCATIAAVKKQNYFIFRECATVAFGTQREMRMRHIIICGLPSSATFFQIIP